MMKFTANVTFKDKQPRVQDDPIVASLVQLLQTLKENNPELLNSVMDSLHLTQEA